MKTLHTLALAGLLSLTLLQTTLSQEALEVTNTLDSGPGSLREALLRANDRPGADRIRFRLPTGMAHTIHLASALPQIIEPLDLDGTSQPGYSGTPLIELNGVNAGPLAHGLHVLGGGSRIRGLAIHRFQGDGIRLEAGGTNTLQALFIGTDLAGQQARGNGQGGITLYQSPGNQIGGSGPGEGNLISGGNLSGIYLLGHRSVGNVIQGNRIGTDRAGQDKLGNLQHGVVLSDAPGNLIGGREPGARNLISGNGQSGVYLIGPACAENRVEGNWIGLAATGTAALANGGDGITVYGAASNVIGATVAAGRNVLSGNGARGVLITGVGADGNRIVGNHIGTDPSGLAALGNRFAGVAIAAGTLNRVGGRAAGAGNLISGNRESGVAITDTASGTRLEGNQIGTDLTGTRPVANAFHGVLVQSSANTVGSSLAAGRNVISGNRQSGVCIMGESASGNEVVGNYIGTSRSGTAALPNALGGVYIYRAAANRIGGTEGGMGNLIAGNEKVGISIGDPGATNNQVLGNWIGVQADAVTPLGNQWHGVEFLNSASNNVVGGTQLGAGNRIWFAGTAGYDGVRIRANCPGNMVRGNSIAGNGGLAIDHGNDGPDTTQTVVLTKSTGNFEVSIQGTLSKLTPLADGWVDVYANATGDPSGYGEAERWLGAVKVRTDAHGQAVLNETLTLPFGFAGRVSATATTATAGTCELSAHIAHTASTWVDRDADGLPDDYETAWGLDPLDPRDAGLDADGDGLSNLSEFRAGTHPRDPANALQLSPGIQERETVSLAFATVPGRTYRVEYRERIDTNWQVLVNGLFGTGGVLQVTEPMGAAESRFYRLVCE